MKVIQVSSPTRVDLAGGTLDLWPLYNFIGGAVTVNVAIEIQTEAVLEPKSTSEIELHSEDLNLAKTFSNLQECLQTDDPALRLLQAQLEYWKPRHGFKLTTRSQSPVGGGLGGSSSLTISLLKAFEAWLHPQESHFKTTHQMVHVAHNLEAGVLGTPTGTQDYYPAASGGLNILTYSSDGIRQEILPIQGTQLEQSFLLVYTGKSHHSGINNFEVLSKAVQRDPQVLTALRALGEISIQTAQACRSQLYEQLPGLFRKEYRERVKLAKAFSSPEIDRLHDLTMQAGASAVKICGAGGGGCVLVWVEPPHREKVRAVCEKNGFRVLDAKPVPPLVPSRALRAGEPVRES